MEMEASKRGSMDDFRGGGAGAGRHLRHCPPSTRRALPALCAAAALTAAVFVLTNGLPSSLFLHDAQGFQGNLTAAHLLDGLLSPEFSHRSCRSRYEFAGYHKKSPHKPSPYLIAKLRKHEALQKRCGPGTASYKKALRRLESGEGVNTADTSSNNKDECRYLVYISFRGLGNRMLSMASAFLYAVLTDRVLLVDNDKAVIGDLFCEPFPGTTWLLPRPGLLSTSPLRRLRHFDQDSKESLGNMLQSGATVASVDGNVTWSAPAAGRTPPFLYVHLGGGYGHHDKLFFCGAHQRLLHSVPWLLFKSDVYTIPGMFLIPTFQHELDAMFPEKDAVFHHLGRYLFHPSNPVWSDITSYHRANLAGHHVVGVQIRVFQDKVQPPQQVLDQVLSCVRDEKLLQLMLPSSTSSNTSTSILVTSLSPWYSERIRAELAGSSTEVHQPSHEGEQRWHDAAHDAHALTDIYLLSTCDVLLTSGYSTFGYVAQGLAGLRPWVLPREPFWAQEGSTEGRGPCRRELSVEPCSHSPSFYDCKAGGRDLDLDSVKYIGRCVDVNWGIKLVNQSSRH
ncbi:hypothetical protein PR202_gb06855 [Eleusine coracana subsp. coracana]|uniref:Fucosyltransferase n=1 Tax=Eleusine coracana subsp. coracana TaxID=191504 RepID=A0AAV5EAP5_ELECO|nr:hypothetical protein QOZ80_2BG0162820 [Eleusine coracana subsp. coracana]GJN19566.1 hypothetical protein PR202_gb06855 [Eleusine coracana subsp. coracana]